MAQIETKALQLRLEAQKKVNGSRNLLQALFGSGQKIEEAIECYQRSGNLYKTIKNWAEAANCFIEAANLTQQYKQRYEAARFFCDAAACFKRYDTKKAVQYSLKAVDLYCDMGRFGNAARLHQAIAEMYLKEEPSADKAAQHFEQAAEFYATEESHAAANKCLLQVAEISAVNEKYQKAIKLFEEIAYYNLANPLLKYGVKDQFFKAGICRLCLDAAEALIALNMYVQNFPSFGDSREYHLLKDLVDCIEKEDPDRFSLLLQKYDAVSRIGEWHVLLLLRVKKKITDEPDLR